MATEGKNLSSFDQEELPNIVGYRFVIVVSDWNRQVTWKLLEGARQTLTDQGCEQENISVFHVPGSFELPLASQLAAERIRPDAVIALGSVIRGETPHFDYVCQAVAQGIKDAALNTGIPVIFGVLTDDNEQQARDRSGGRLGNKGVEAAISAIRMSFLSRQITGA